MKNSIVLLLFLSVFQAYYSQEITGVATYKSFVKMDMKMDSTQVSAEMREQIRQMVIQQTQKEYELQFNNNESLFKEKTKLDKPGNNMFENAVVSTYGGLESVYQNLKEGHQTSQRDILGKMFLINDTLGNKGWKLQKETKNIGEYVCFKAVLPTEEGGEPAENNEKETVAWYTPQIPLGFGPMGYGGLPGLILELKAGDVTYLCNQIVLNSKKGMDISVPTGGKEVSKEEFERIKDKKLQEKQEHTHLRNSHTIEIKVGG